MLRSPSGLLIFGVVFRETVAVLILLGHGILQNFLSGFALHDGRHVGVAHPIDGRRSDWSTRNQIDSAPPSQTGGSFTITNSHFFRFAFSSVSLFLHLLQLFVHDRKTRSGNVCTILFFRAKFVSSVQNREFQIHASTRKCIFVARNDTDKTRLSYLQKKLHKCSEFKQFVLPLSP